MAATSAAPPPSSKHQWWHRSSASSKQFALLRPGLHFSSRPFMSPVTTTKPMSFMTPSTKSKFNLAAVLPSFATRSKKQQSLEIQDPPPHIRHSSNQSPLSSPSSPSSIPSPRLSRGSSIPYPRPSKGVAYSTSSASRTSRTSTDRSLIPTDNRGPGPATHTSYQHHLITPANSNDHFTPDPLRIERPMSTHSDKSAKRILSRVDSKSKSTSRLPLSEAAKNRESRDSRGSTLPSRARSETDPADMYLPLRAVEPPWQPSSPPASPISTLAALPRDLVVDYPPRASPGLLRKSRSASAKATFARPDIRPASQLHQHTRSSSSIASELPVGNPSLSSVLPPSAPSPTASAVDILQPQMPSPVAATRPPRPPPTQELPPTPGSSALHAVAAASVSAVSFASSLSSLSFTSRPSPQEPVPPQAYPSLLAETLPADAIRRASDSSSSGRSAPRVGPPKHGARPLPVPPRERERTLSAGAESVKSFSDTARVLRKQRSFHNMAPQAPPAPSLRHYSSFEPPVPAARRATSPGRDGLASPRRRLFSSRKHDADAAPPTTLVRRGSTSRRTETQPPAAVPPLSPSSQNPDVPPAPEPAPEPDPPDVAQHIVPPAELLRLGAAWERENESLQHTTTPPSSPRSPRSSRLPRSASLFAHTSSVPAPRPAPVPAPAPTDSWTSLSPPPRRAMTRRTLSNDAAAAAAAAAARRTISNDAAVAAAPKRGARIERKPSFLDMTTRRSVSIELPDPRDSFLELSRGMDSIETIRESEASFQ